VNLSGLAIPTLTQFGDDGSLDGPKNAQFARRLSEAGAEHLFVLGSMGEFPSLDTTERAALLEATIESLSPKTDAWVGCGAPSTRQAVANAVQAEEAGAAAIVAVPPYYLHPAPASIATYYRTLRAAIRIPLLAYNIPSLVGYALDPELVARLARDNVLAGLKDTSGSLESVERFLRAAPRELAIFPGDDRFASYSMARGAAGAVMGTGNIVPRLAIALVAAAKAENAEETRRLQSLVDRLATVAAEGPFPSTAKYLAHRLWGAAVGYRAPYDPLTDEERARVDAGLAGLEPELREFR
jgi:4-hydroxy-tetrahydrodipicolinate synthase